MSVRSDYRRSVRALSRPHAAGGRGCAGHRNAASLIPTRNGFGAVTRGSRRERPQTGLLGDGGLLFARGAVNVLSPLVPADSAHQGEPYASGRAGERQDTMGNAVIVPAEGTHGFGSGVNVNHGAHLNFGEKRARVTARVARGSESDLTLCASSEQSKHSHRWQWPVIITDIRFSLAWTCRRTALHISRTAAHWTAAREKPGARVPDYESKRKATTRESDDAGRR